MKQPLPCPDVSEGYPVEVINFQLRYLGGPQGKRAPQLIYISP